MGRVLWDDSAKILSGDILPCAKITAPATRPPLPQPETPKRLYSKAFPTPPNFGRPRALRLGVIHPFSHLNSNLAAARLGVSPRSRNTEAPRFPNPAENARSESAAVRAPVRRRVLDASPTAETLPGRSRSGNSPQPPSGPPSVDPSPTAPAPDGIPGRSRSGGATPSVDPNPAPPPAPPPGPPRFDDVPESVRYPNGPYRQAPAEFGGQWWLVSPFTGETPWVTQLASTAPPPAPPAEFTAVFGERPSRSGAAAALEWDQDLAHFKRVGVPEGFSSEQIQAAGDIFEQWGLGRPVFVEGRYGWSARFPDSQIPGFQASPFTAVEAPHLVVARYQIRMTQEGEAPAQQHPFVPPQLFGHEPIEQQLRSA